MQGIFGRLILLSAALSYVSLAIYISVVTWQATGPMTVAHVSDGVAGGFMALATALGAGYATKLGVPVNPTFTDPSKRLLKVWEWIKAIFTTGNAIWLDIFAYFAVGGLLLLTYLCRQIQSPGCLKTVAVAFGGYTLAYVTKTLSA